MKKLLFILLFLPTLLNAQDLGYDRYVVPIDSTYAGMNQSSDSNDGSYLNPWATWEKGVDATLSGETLCLRGGTHWCKWTNYNNATLTNDSVTIRGYPGEQPIINGDSLGDYIDMGEQTNIYNFAIQMNTHAHDSLINLEFINFNQYFQTKENGDTISWLPIYGVIYAYNCVHMYYEDVHIHDGMMKGFVQYSGYWNDYDSTYAVDVYGSSPESASPPFDSVFGDTTKWVDCDVYNMADSLSWEVGTMDWEGGNHADGWKGANYQNSVYSWIRCRGWNYTDDGIDFNMPGYKIFDNCWMMSNSYKKDVLPEFEGAGIKQTANPRDEIYFPQYLTDTNLVKYNNCVITYCSNGYLNDFFVDQPEGSVKASTNALVYNSVGYHNFRNIDAPVPQGDTVLSIDMKNSLMFDAIGNQTCSKVPDINTIGGVNLDFALGTGSHKNNIYYTGYDAGSCPRWGYDTQYFTVTSADFVNALDSATIIDEISAPRNEDNSLPVNPFRLDPDSDLIDAGVDVGFAYNGTAPDVGADEYASVGSAPSTTYYGRGNGKAPSYKGKIGVLRQ